MRLTLRTLLAYRDQVLEAKDAEILEQRLRESQTAQSISDRINHLLSNPQVAPIHVEAGAFGFNANDVARFLDDTMPIERIVDMERKCIDDDSLLADVATCHQILAEVVRNPLPASSSLRHRMVALWNQRIASVDSPPPFPGARRLREDSAHRSVPQPLGLDLATGSPTREAKGKAAETVAAGERLVEESARRSNRRIHDYLEQSNTPWIGPALRLFVMLVIFAVCVAQTMGSRQRLRELLERQPTDSSSKPPGAPSLEPTER